LAWEERALIKLSICIATFGRGDFIAETIESIVQQLTPSIEIVIVDGASPDNTCEVVSRFVDRHPNIRYYREEVNSGADADFDKSVSYARGVYCWLFPDDDILIPDAIAKVLKLCEQEPELIISDSRVLDVSLTNVIVI
jgi:abequosyltransferase